MKWGFPVKKTRKEKTIVGDKDEWGRISSPFIKKGKLIMNIQVNKDELKYLKIQSELIRERIDKLVEEEGIFVLGNLFIPGLLRILDQGIQKMLDGESIHSDNIE